MPLEPLPYDGAINSIVRRLRGAEMSDPFHEAKEALATVKREFTQVGSLNAVTTFSASLACETAVAVLWREATSSDFPYQKFPRHKPGQWVGALGIKQYYTPETQRFIQKFDSYAPDKIRYDTTHAFREHIRPESSGRGKEIVVGVERFVGETEHLLSSSDVLNTLRASSKIKL